MNIKSFLIKKLIHTRRDIFTAFRNFKENESERLITYFNQHSFNLLWERHDYRNVINYFNVYQEGIGMFLLLKFLKVKNLDRVDSFEIIKFIFEDINSLMVSVAFVGGYYDINEFLNRCKKNGLNIYYYHHGFFDHEHIKILAEELKSKQVKFVFLGMGSPKQEIVAYELSKLMPDTKFICVGNFFNIYLNYQKRAPFIFRKLQLEWFFRLLREPKRLSKRYVLGIPLFFLRSLLFLRKN